MGGSKSKYQRMVDEDVDAEALDKSFYQIITGLGDFSFNAPTSTGTDLVGVLRQLPTLVTAVIGEAAKVR